MAETITLAELLDELGELGEELSNPQEILTELGSDLTEQMRIDAPVSPGGGALRDSIGYTVNGNEIQFRMLYYGFFQNYGVSGTDDSFGTEVPSDLLPPTNGKFYKFGTRRFGLRRQEFFNYDRGPQSITQTIIDGIASFTADF